MTNRVQNSPRGDGDENTLPAGAFYVPAAEVKRDAAMLDEGAFIGATRIRRSGEDTHYVAPRVMVTRVSPYALDAMAARWGGRVRGVGRSTKHTGPDSYVWTLTRKADVERFLVRVLPYLTTARSRAATTRELAGLPRLLKNDPDRDVLIERRERLYSDLRDMNARNSAY